MANLEMVFRGVHSFCFDLPETKNYGKVKLPGFEAVCSFGALGQLQFSDDPDFTYAQAVCVSKAENYGFRDSDSDFVLVHPDAVCWVLCFPVVRRGSRKYVPKTNAIEPEAAHVPSGDRVFFCFSSAVKAISCEMYVRYVRAVPYLGSLDLLSPDSEDKLALVRASRWRWNPSRNAVLIRPKYVLETETVSDSGLCVP